MGVVLPMHGCGARISPPLTDFFTALPFRIIEEIAGAVRPADQQLVLTVDSAGGKICRCRFEGKAGVRHDKA